jgi:hypothetical protein
MPYGSPESNVSKNRIRLFAVMTPSSCRGSASATANPDIQNNRLKPVRANAKTGNTLNLFFLFKGGISPIYFSMAILLLLSALY